MLLLLIDSVLLIFITLSLGIFTHFILEKAFRSPLQTDLLGIFILGLISSTFYFDILSFWWPVNYLTLIPLLLSGLLISWRLRGRMNKMRYSISNSLKFAFSAPYLLITLCVLITLFFYWIIPPSNYDSWSYHFLSILWYEKFKVVPGLVNVHGRFAFNPASFIIQAAYSFTAVTGQSLYPLNGVLLALFFLWLLIRLFRSGNSSTGLIYGALILMLYKPMLVNISSPSSDTLVAVCTCYSLISLFQILLAKDVSLSGVLAPSLIILYSLTAKLSSFPILLTLPYIFFLLPKKERKISLLLKTLAVALLIYLPWLGRNYILSGYLIYPFPYLDLFQPDWKAPLSILKLEIYYINVWSKTGSPMVTLSAPLPLSKWLIPWYNTFFRHTTPLDFIIFMAGMLSPLYWISLYMKLKKVEIQPFILWLILYMGVWIWFFTSPVLRFGVVLLSLSIIFPALVFFSKRISGLYNRILQLSFTCSVFYSLIIGYKMPTTYRFTLKDCWLYPLKDIYYTTKEKADFPYKILRSGTRLYLSDDRHKCINTDLPCMEDYYGEIEMRGSKIDQGFRMVKDETLLNFPYIR